jgi:hypothetical protein
MDHRAIQCLKAERGIQSPLDFFWIAEYADRSFLCQYEQDGKENLFKDINHDSLSKFYLVANNGTDRLFSVSLNPLDDKLIYFRRHFQTINPHSHCMFYALGYQKKNADEKSITFITPEGDIVMESDLPILARDKRLKGDVK